MAMTSEEVNQLISSQTAAIAQANANATRMGYAQGLAEQGPQGDPIGAAIPSMAAGAASYAGNLPNAVMPAVSLAAGFGLLPRVLDPFTQSLSIGNVAAKAGGGWMGGGLAAGIGAAAIPFAAYTAAGAAADHLALDPFKTGAQMRGAALGAIQSYMPDSPMSSMGATASMMESMQRNKQFSMQDTMGLMSLGVAGGSINTNNMSQFQSSFKSLINETQQVAQALSSSLSEAYGAMQQIKGLGVSSASGTAYAMRGLGVAGGIAPAEMMGIAQGGASLAKMAGISRDVGVAGAMTSAATFGMVGNNKSLGADFGMDDLGMMQNAGYRFFGSRQGSSVVAAMMDESGDFDTSVATRIAQGTMTKAEINRRASITRNKRPDMLAANSTEIVAQYMSEYGPQGISNPLTTMVRGMANPESAKMQMTGLNQEGLGELSSLSMNSGSIKAQLSQAAQEGFNQGTQRLGLADSLQLAMQKMTAPIRDKFQQMGSQVAQSIAETVDDVTRDFMTRPAMRSDMSGANAIQSFNQQGNFTAANNVRGAISSVEASAVIGTPGTPGFFAGALVPQGLRAGGEMQDPSRQFLNGFAPVNPGMGALLTTGAVMAARSGTADLVGTSLGVLGAEMVDKLPKSGFMGGRQISSFAALGARGTQGAGLLVRGGSKMLGGPLGVALAVTEVGLAGINAWGTHIGAESGTDADTGPVGEMMGLERSMGVAGSGEGREIWGTVSHVRGQFASHGGVKRQVQRFLDVEANAALNDRITNAGSYASTDAAVRKRLGPKSALEAENILGTTRTTESQKALRLMKELGISMDEAKSMIITAPHASWRALEENNYAATIQKWYKEVDTEDEYDKDSPWYELRGNAYSAEVKRGAGWLERNESRVAAAAASVATSGAAVGAVDSPEFQKLLREKVLAGLNSEESLAASTAMSAIAGTGALKVVAGIGVKPLLKGWREQEVANRTVNNESAGRTEKYIDYAATAAGINPVGMRSAHKEFLNSYADSTAQTRLVQGAVGSQELASAESQAIMAANLARDPSQFGQQASALLSIQARVKGLDEAYLDGKKSSGKKWVEEFLGIQVGGGVDKSLRGENDITPVKTRERIRKGVEQMLSANLGVDPAQFSTEQVSTVDITTRKIIRHAQEKDGGNVKEIAALFMPMKTSASPDKSEGQQAMMMQRMEKVIGSLTEQLKNLSDRLPQTSGG